MVIRNAQCIKLRPQIRKFINHLPRCLKARLITHVRKRTVLRLSVSDGKAAALWVVEVQWVHDAVE